MICRWTPSSPVPALAAFVLCASLASQAQTKPLLVTERIDNSVLVTLAGNTRPEANASNDQGPLSANVQFDHMLMAELGPVWRDLWARDQRCCRGNLMARVGGLCSQRGVRQQRHHRFLRDLESG